MKRTQLIGLSLAVMLFLACGGGRSERFVKNPVDDIIRDMPAGVVFSILLHDMNVEGNFRESFYHQYTIIQETEPGKPEERTTEWMEVSESYFKQHQDDMGMELASKGEDGQLVKTVSPPGYNNYVGNEKYGHWQQGSNGTSFWAFYGQYAFMSSMFRMATYPVRRSYYDDYRGNYYGRGRSYYGPSNSGRSYYGTNSDYNTNRRTSSTWSQNRSNFKNRVNSRTQRSSTSSSRTSRSSSRYRGSSSRSRGGGYGK
ncbi:MAG: hypothetical protein HEP71_08750 [Roseivirga sp.]|nr:hypothetical protein [Roseivirga sp.]